VTSVCLLSYSVFCLIPSSVVFSPWGRFWSNCMEITSFSSRVITFFAVTLLWRFFAVWTETFLYALPRNRHDSVFNALLLQSYSLLWKRVPIIRCPAAAPSVLPREGAHRSPAQQKGRLQLSGVMSQYVYVLCWTLSIVLGPLSSFPLGTGKDFVHLGTSEGASLDWWASDQDLHLLMGPTG
jgi:hypothetical protein